MVGMCDITEEDRDKGEEHGAVTQDNALDNRTRPLLSSGTSFRPRGIRER